MSKQARGRHSYEGDSHPTVLGSGNSHQIELVPRARIRLQIVGHTGRPAGDTKYDLELDGNPLPGTTDGDGWTTEFDARGICRGRLEVSGMVYEILFQKEDASDIAWAQSLLNALGFEAGPVDGVERRRTKHALRSYQRTRGLAVTGKFDGVTKQELLEEHRHE